MKLTPPTRWTPSQIVQAIIAIASTAAIIYLAIASMTIPEVLVGLVMAIIGYYFGKETSTSTP